MEEGRILVVDDDEVARKSLRRIMSKQGYSVVAAGDAPSALRQLERAPFDVVVTDLVMDEMDGLELLDSVKRYYPGVEVIVVTGHASIPSAIEAMKKGAYHYLVKPFRPEEVGHLVGRALETVLLRRQVEDLAAAAKGTPHETALLGESPEMLQVREVITQVAVTDCNVLLVGESGTGKELAASLIHFHSRRSHGKFLPINCGAFAEELLANELFGHEKGAFTGATQTRPGLLESAGGGTLLLDEVGDMPLSMQVKLLRAIQEREVIRVGGTRPVPFDARIIAATNQDLKKAVAAGRFRHDLYYRLNVVSIKIPPLRERKRDIPLLASYFLNRASREAGKQVTGFSSEALEALVAYSFPGNVRELQNVVERAVTMTRSDTVQPVDLPPDISEMDVFSFDQQDPGIRSLRDIQQEYIQWVLRRVGRNKTRAAQLLGIDRSSLWRYLKQYELEEDR